MSSLADGGKKITTWPPSILDPLRVDEVSQFPLKTAILFIPIALLIICRADFNPAGRCSYWIPIVTSLVTLVFGTVIVTEKVSPLSLPI